MELRLAWSVLLTVFAVGAAVALIVMDSRGWAYLTPAGVALLAGQSWYLYVLGRRRNGSSSGPV